MLLNTIKRLYGLDVFLKFVCISLYIMGFFMPLIPDIIRKHILDDTYNLLYLNDYYFGSISGLSNLLVVLFFSSLAFLLLSLYACHVFLNEILSTHAKNLRLSGIAGAFVITCLYVFWSCSPLRVGLINIFPVFSFAVMVLGYIIGAMIFELRSWMSILNK